MKALHIKAKQDKLSLTASRALVTDNLGNVTASVTTSAELSKLNGLTATTTELNYVDGVTSPIQTQLNGKANSTHTHDYAPTTHTHSTSDITGLSTALNGKQDAISGAANAVMITDANGKPTVSSVITVAELNKLNGLTPTTTELNYLNNATSNIQTQLNAKAGFPNYSSATNVLTSEGSTYTPTANGYLYLSGGYNNAHITVYIEGFTVDLGSSDANVDLGVNNILLPVAKGTVIECLNRSGNPICRWINAN